MSGTCLMHVYLAEMPPWLFRLPPTQMYENMNTGCLIRNDKHLFAHCYAEIELLKALSRVSQTFVRRWSSPKCHVNPLSVFRIMISILPNEWQTAELYATTKISCHSSTKGPLELFDFQSVFPSLSLSVSLAALHPTTKPSELLNLAKEREVAKKDQFTSIGVVVLVSSCQEEFQEFHRSWNIL